MPDSELTGSATYEIIRARLDKEEARLREQMQLLDAHRKDVFGSVGFALLQGDKISTPHHCIAQDMTELGQGRFLFGFNVTFGLIDKTAPGDVFAVYRRNEEAGTFHPDEEMEAKVLNAPAFIENFNRIYRMYDTVSFSKFSETVGCLFMVFKVGATDSDIAVFKWRVTTQGLQFEDGRAESEFRSEVSPPSHHFAWRSPDRDSFRYGEHPHVSIENRVFVDCLAGDLTIKVEDNTASGAGIYSEPVEDSKQKIDDAEISYATLGHLVLLRIRPYKERTYRYFIFNQKLARVDRVDSIGDSCAALPDDHGLLFADGYYLATGELKVFGGAAGHRLERMIPSPNGEDFLFVFYSSSSGEYSLMPYRLIEQRVEERIVCHGFCIFPDGQMILFRSGGLEAQKHHTIQLRQTPFYDVSFEPAGKKDQFLYSVGNREVVRCLSEIQEILSLLSRQDPYAELYTDVVRRCGSLIDAFPWLGSLTPQTGALLPESIAAVRQAADTAVDEFDNVLRLKREAEEKTTAAEKRVVDLCDEVRRQVFVSLEDFAAMLGSLRALTGELSALKETRYTDPDRIAESESKVAEESAALARQCVEFLLTPESLKPYQTKAEEHRLNARKLNKVSEADALEKSVSETAQELETLIETLNSLPIEDATETTRILDGITAIYTTINQARGEIRNRRKDLGAGEAKARFAAAIRLLTQSTSSYLDLCDTPAKCDEYLARIGMQIQEMEGTFAEYDEYIAEIAEKRDGISQAFDQRRTSLLEARTKKAASVQAAADRILKIIENRLAALGSPQEIAAYLSSDPMPARVRDSVQQLLDLEDPLKADDLSTRLKSLGQQATRQLKDRQELFADGDNVIRIGKHRFNTNPQPLDLTVVIRDGEQFLHLTGTRFFQKLDDPEFLATRDVWDQQLVSENETVYRAETLAWKFLQSLPEAGLAEWMEKNEADVTAAIGAFMANRYSEGYTRGIHDLDAAKIFRALVNARVGLGLAWLPPEVRSMARAFWCAFADESSKEVWVKTFASARSRKKAFQAASQPIAPPADLCDALERFANEPGLFPSRHALSAAEYLFLVFTGGGDHEQTREGSELLEAFEKHLKESGAREGFTNAVEGLAEHPSERLRAIREWVASFVSESPTSEPFAEEAVAAIFCADSTVARDAASQAALDGMKGAHPLISSGTYHFDLQDFLRRISAFENTKVPQFLDYTRIKNEIIQKNRDWMRLESFAPKVLTSFVRNQLIDEVYLPLIGNNLAKQMGAAGDNARTDRSGLLLLVSPPGYGKTTLLEYLASRLGIQFVKINGPALGFHTTSLDPEEAPNAAAREEIERLNFALEMGDNILLCIDDIQHCSSEFLQKFISLCDAQRKIEGVWRGRSKTHDFRGRKVVVAMAGNPYTETGQRFRIPDMLSNRADTYNLGDIVGGNARAFEASYIENAATSNPVLSAVANKSQKDIRTFLAMARSGDRATGSERFEASYSSKEVEETLSVLEKLIRVRDAVLAVNLEYIRSAAQSDEFRTEPPFKLQGSYRNMNRLAERILPALTAAEVEALLLDHYNNESQTLTADTEANLLKLRELWGLLSEVDAKRWEEIKRTFQRNQVSGREDDPAARIAGQIGLVGVGFEQARDALAGNLTKLDSSLQQGLSKIQETVGESIGTVMRNADKSESPARMANIEHEVEMLHKTMAAVQDLAIQQRDKLEKARAELALRAKQGVVEIDLTDEMLLNQEAFLEHFQNVMKARRGEPDPPPK